MSLIPNSSSSPQALDALQLPEAPPSNTLRTQVAGVAQEMLTTIGRASEGSAPLTLASVPPEDFESRTRLLQQSIELSRAVWEILSDNELSPSEVSLALEELLEGAQVHGSDEDTAPDRKMSTFQEVLEAAREDLTFDPEVLDLLESIDLELELSESEEPHDFEMMELSDGLVTQDEMDYLQSVLEDLIEARLDGIDEQ